MFEKWEGVFDLCFGAKETRVHKYKLREGNLSLKPCTVNAFNIVLLDRWKNSYHCIYGKVFSLLSSFTSLRGLEKVQQRNKQDVFSIVLLGN